MNYLLLFSLSLFLFSSNFAMDDGFLSEVPSANDDISKISLEGCKQGVVWGLGTKTGEIAQAYANGKTYTIYHGEIIISKYLHGKFVKKSYNLENFKPLKPFTICSNEVLVFFNTAFYHTPLLTYYHSYGQFLVKYMKDQKSYFGLLPADLKNELLALYVKPSTDYACIDSYLTAQEKEKSEQKFSDEMLEILAQRTKAP